MILDGLARAQHVACVSEATRAELLRLTSLPASRVSRIYNGLNYPYSPMPQHEAASRVRALGVEPEHPFVLHIGGNSWYKNREGVLRIFAALRQRTGEGGAKLVMAGKPWTPAMKAFVSEARLEGAAMELGGVTNEDLRALYSTARIMLFPSLEEGFGWPILEAQACGCAVITSNRSPMNEVGGAAAVYVDPEDTEGAAAVVADALRCADQRRKPSVQNALRFSTAEMLRAYLELYRKVAHEYS